MATGEDFDRATLRKLGCRAVQGNHQKRGFYINGRLVGWCMRSHSLRNNSTISPQILKMMALEMRCSLSLWKELLACPATREDYLQELLAADRITEEEYRIAAGFPP